MQVYKPPIADHLLELPLHVMDTSLFYPAHMGLSRREAHTILCTMIDNAVRFGGCLTINWHDRSVAPERLWDEFYSELIEDLKSRGAWFARAGQAVAWFRERRSVEFESSPAGGRIVRARASDREGGLPALRLRIHNAQLSSGAGAAVEHHLDTVLGENPACFQMEAR
jgi:hypothetical protein